VTDLEKKIYNKHLAISRSLRNKPFKIRTDFSKFDIVKQNWLKKLAIFFSKHPDVSIDVYFSAPYKLYNDTEYFDLSYYASLKGIKSYSIYKQQLLKTSPDEQLPEVKESLIFIAHFCIQNKIQLDEYTQFKQTSLEPEWIYHYKKNKINLYSLMEFANMYHIISEIPPDERELLLGDFGKNFIEYKTRYKHSQKLRNYLQEAYIKIKLFVDKTLNTTQKPIQ